MSDMTVANTILDQIGRRALIMIGAKTPVGDEKSVRFKIGRNEKSVTHVVVTLDPSDTYTLSFLRARGVTAKEVSNASFVYADQLRSVIEKHTGLYTSL
jgi:hypothetical protein